MGDGDSATDRWLGFLDAVEQSLDHLGDTGRVPMIVRPPADARLPAELAERGRAARDRLDSAQAEIEASLDALDATRSRLTHHPRFESVAAPAVLDTRA